MLFAVTMRVDLPHDLDPADRAKTLEEETEYSQSLQSTGQWVHLWRIAGAYANLSIFDVTDSEELHRILWNLPLFPYMDVDVTPLVGHPSAL